MRRFSSHLEEQSKELCKENLNERDPSFVLSIRAAGICPDRLFPDKFLQQLYDR